MKLAKEYVLELSHEAPQHCPFMRNVAVAAHIVINTPRSIWLTYSPTFDVSRPSETAAMSFVNAPVSRLLVLGVVASSLAASLLDIKHYFYIRVDIHLWRHWQLWRLLAFQMLYTNSAELLFAAVTLYHLRVVERLWGSRKFGVSARLAV